MTMTPIERRVRFIFGVECALFFIHVAKVLTIIITAAFFPDTFVEFVLGDFADWESIKDALYTVIKLSIVFWAIELAIEFGLLFVYYRGMTKKIHRLLRRWMYIGWVIVFFIIAGFIIQLIDNRWESRVQIVSTTYSVVYAVYRIWANMLILVYVDELKKGLGSNPVKEIKKLSVHSVNYDAGVITTTA